MLSRRSTLRPFLLSTFNAATECWSWPGGTDPCTPPLRRRHRLRRLFTAAVASASAAAALVFAVSSAAATTAAAAADVMREEELEIAIKVVIVGNGAVGKSSMIQRYCKGTFTKDYKKTIGVDFLERQIVLDGEEVRLMLWDTAGQEEFDAITKSYYRGAQACVLAFSTTDRDSFEAAHSWKMKVEDECGEIPTVLVQNKIDLVDQSVVDPEEADLLARALGCRLLRTSVKEDINVNAVFHHLAASCLAELHEQEEEYSMSGGGFMPLTISSFSPMSQNGKNHYGNETIVLQSTKQKSHKKKNVLRNACRIL